MTVICTSHIAICNTGIITGSCCIIISLTKDIEQSLQRINRKVKNNNKDYCLDQFSKFVQFHANAIQLSEELLHIKMLFTIQPQLDVFGCFFFRLVRDFSEAFDVIIMAFCLWSFATICGILLMIQMETVRSFSIFGIISQVHLVIFL